ncbi:MAG: hypothetical protein O3C40_33445 [Planctomycetota bacterium]|nr:hypothetical protein [Planctomycetota bacterium]
MVKLSRGCCAVLLTMLVAFSSGIAEDRSGQPTPLELFNQRIMPIFRSPQPSSCVQCHLAAVDLKQYILPSHEKTFASLRDQGLIDLEHPEKSKVLTLIRMGDKDLDEGAKLIHEKTRLAEYQAFASWIEACCNDPKLRDAPGLTAQERARPERPDEVIRHARKSRVVDSFVRNVWSQRMRCFPCHTPHEIDPSNPQHQAAVKTHREFSEKLDAALVARMDIFRETPEATLAYLIDRSRDVKAGELPLINLEEPRDSLILLKPMSKLPVKKADGTFEPASSALPISHMGGLKMHKDDQSYKSFVAWLEDYANVVGNRYAAVDDLPADNWVASNRFLQIAGAPESWPIEIPVQLFVHTWDEKAASWQRDPIAFTQGTVTPRRMVNGSLFVFASPANEPADREHQLVGGRYLIKAYVDFRHRLEDDPTLLLGEEDFYGQTDLHRTTWRDGFKAAASVPGNKLLKQ